MLDTFLHWIHLLAACTWVGGMIAVSFVVQPALRALLPPETRLAAYREIGRRFTKVQWYAWFALAATGGHKLWGLRGSPDVFLGPFGVLLSVKLCLIGAMVTLSLLHTFKWGPELVEKGPSDPQYPRLLRRMALWGGANLALTLGIVLCAALLRFNPF